MALDREIVVRTALQVLDEVGLEGLTLRKIATALDVQAPALYWHFKNKQALLDEMATTILADNIRDIGLPSGEGSWDDWAISYGIGLRHMLLRYRDGAKMFSGTYLTDSALYAPMETALQKLTTAGFSLLEAISGLATIYYYTVGFTIEEQAIHPRPSELNQQYDLAKRDERIDGATFPLALAAGAEIFSNFDQRFEQGLKLIIAGLAQKSAGAEQGV
jgi:TetR/AcrR family transcriptional regulator, tetracycline repressor protein